MDVITLDPGDRVFCDAACGEDYTNSEESGGILFGSKAYCPKCAARSMPNIISYGEQSHIKATCPDGMSFADWVRGCLR